MSQQILSDYEKRSEHFARCEAIIMQAVNDIYEHRLDGKLNYFAMDRDNTFLGPTYIEIRNWIEVHKRFIMENVGGRCRSLARDKRPPWLEIEYDSNRRVHVYPKQEEWKGRTKQQ